MNKKQMITSLHLNLSKYLEIAKGYQEMGELNLELANEGNVFEYELVTEKTEGETF